MGTLQKNNQLEVNYSLFQDSRQIALAQELEQAIKNRRTLFTFTSPSAHKHAFTYLMMDLSSAFPHEGNGSATMDLLAKSLGLNDRGHIHHMLMTHNDAMSRKNYFRSFIDVVLDVPSLGGYNEKYSEASIRLLFKDIEGNLPRYLYNVEERRPLSERQSNMIDQLFAAAITETITIEDLKSDSRKRAVLRRRMMVTSTLSNFFGEQGTAEHLSSARIGETIGGKDHATVLHSKRIHNEMLANNLLYRKDIIAFWLKVPLLAEIDPKYAPEVLLKIDFESDTDFLPYYCKTRS